LAEEAQGDGLSLAALMDIKLQTGSFLELDLAKSPLSMTIIDRNKIRSSGARHMSELLEVYVPGFQYMYNKWNGVIWGMRGVANDRNTKIIYLVNGHKLNHESRDGAMSELTLGMLGDIERVEVLRGPAGLVYGSGAIAGIVNVVTRSATENASDVVATVGGWNGSQTWKQGEAWISKSLPKGGLAFGFGWLQSDGAGNQATRLYGKPHWPYRSGDIDTSSAPAWRKRDASLWKAHPTPEGVPSNGSAHSTPGNWRADLDYVVGDFRLWARATHQVQNGSPLFPYNAWPDRPSLGADSTFPNRMIDGRSVPYGTAPYDETPWNTERRQYMTDNFTVEGQYTLPLAENSLKFKAGWDGVTNRIQRERLPGYEGYYSTETHPFREETFGERRTTLGLMYLLKSVSKLQLAAGYEFRWDDIGDDMEGHNSQAEKATHPIVSDVDYYNNALYFEGYYTINDQFGVHGGMRYDAHTRTVEDGGTIAPKAAVIYTPADGHTIKAIFQGAANNGSADNYEYNRNNYNDEGKPYDAYHYEKPYERPGGNSTPIPGASEDDLHELKPEKSYSFELTSSHTLPMGFYVSPSVSYNVIQDLFAWDQNLFRIVNVGEYKYMNVDLDASWTSSMVDVGVNHTWQAPLMSKEDVADQAKTSPRRSFVPDSVYDAGVGKWKYFPRETGVVRDAAGKVVYDTINPVKTQITFDGEHFLSLADHVTKFYVDMRVNKELSLHTDMRVFWGLPGRESMISADEKLGYNYWNIDEDAMVKWNASVHWSLPDDWRVSAYVYDILGSDDGTSSADNGMAAHTLRWQQMGASDHRDLFAVDVRSYALTVEKGF
jgi:outer membrane receptor protein involved in Fe transport